MAAEEKKLNLYIWSDYLLEDVIKAFGKQTGIKVTYDTYDSNEALETKLQLVWPTTTWSSPRTT